MRKSVLLSALAALLLAAAVFGAAAQRPEERRFVALSAEERAWLDDNRDSIILTYDAAYPPLEFQDEQGQYAGVAADIVAQVERLLGVRFRKRSSRDWNTLLAELESGATHLNGGMVRTPERENIAYFTAPYITLPLVIITSARAFPRAATWNSLKGRRVGAVAGYVSEDYVRERARNSFEVVPLGSVQEGLRDVSFGVVDAFVDNLATSSYFIEKDALANLRVAGTTDYAFPLSISVSRKHPLLYSAVQKALAEIPQSDLEASRKRWISLSGEGRLNPETVRLLQLAGLFTALLLLCLGAISFFLKRRLNEKVKSLRQAQQELMEQTERLGLATEATNAGVWDFYPATGQAYFSSQWYAMLGLEPGAVEPTFAGWVGLMHPHDRPSADHALTDYIDSGGQGLFEAEYRMRQADGSHRWVLGKGRAVAWDPGGRPTRMVGLNLDIQKLKDVQEELRKSEALAKAAFDQTFQLCALLTTDGLVVDVNRSALAFSGVSRAEVAGRPFWHCPWWPDRQEAEGFLRRAIATVLAGGVIRREVVNTDAGGNRAVIDFSLSPLTGADGSVSFLIAEGRDITEMRQAETALKQSEEKFSRIFEMAPESISFIRLKDSVRIDANAAFETITGYPRSESVGHPAPDLGIWDDPAMRDEFLRRLMADGHVKDFEFLLRRKDGALRRVVSSAQLVNISGEECYVNVIHDSTDERRMQELLIQSEKMMSVGSLAAGIAHEINNPLGIVHQAVQNLILRTSPEQKKNLETAAALGLSMDLLQQYFKARKLDVFLEDIQAAALRASGIIRNMLNFSRRSESKRQTCDLQRIVEQSVFLASSDYDLKKSYDFKRIEIRQDMGEDLPACNCTETEIEQVLLNLLRNAAQAMAMAHPPTPNPRIDIRLRAGESCVRIEVADNGPGMDQETQRKVFEPFYTTKPPGVGTGLGLSVSYFIVTKGHGGRMWLVSTPGQGSTFFIELPANPQEAGHG
ncbi:MAG: transporter substrate-binding domain-containing protein [Humidesulfovibrio sp.]